MAQAALNNGNTDQELTLAREAVSKDQSDPQAQSVFAQAAYAPGTVRLFAGHEEIVTAVAVSPDRKQALSASRDQQLILWDISTGREIRRFSCICLSR